MLAGISDFISAARSRQWPRAFDAMPPLLPTIISTPPLSIAQCRPVSDHAAPLFSPQFTFVSIGDLPIGQAGVLRDCRALDDVSEGNESPGKLLAMDRGDSVQGAPGAVQSGGCAFVPVLSAQEGFAAR